MTKPYEYNEESRKHRIEGEPAPSVTQILGVLDKPGLPWWGYRIAIEGVVHMQRLFEEDGELLPNTQTELEALLKAHKYSPSQSLSSAGQRGVAVHQAAEDWATKQKVPNPKDFPEEQRGYIQSLAKWFVSDEPEFLETEVVVASREHRFIGKFDFRARIGDHIVIGDYKTSKAIYTDSMYPQLAAYELASVEMGNDPTDNQIIVRLQADGEAPEVGVSVAEAADFLGIKAAWDARKRIQDRAKAEKTTKSRKGRKKAVKP
jgi:hypothetical protein